MLYFTVAIFLSAFLLFQVQPMIGKFILPWFGGTPAVWSTALLFFQAMLTGGYAYAYWLVKRPKQGWIHLALLGMTLALLTTLGLVWSSPITPPADLRPAAVDFPVFQIIVLLALCVGLPYFVLAANGPLMQAWFSRIFPERSYARLYALSNAGSLLGLVVYPILIEPLFAVNQQAWIWTLGFVVFALVAGLLSYHARNERGVSPTVALTEKPSVSMRVLWIVLSGTASLFLLSVTSRITQEVAVIPFLWVIPLTIYLLSFILTFSDSRWYDRRIYAVLFGVLSIFVWGMPGAVTGQNVVVQIGFYALMLFLACMICHGELYRLRPHADHLTSFYLMISIGGAAGGIFVNLVAPFIFTGYWEFYLAWLLTAALLVGALLPRLRERVDFQAAALTLSIPLMIVGLALWLNPLYGALFADRNFYGLVRVRQWGGSAYSMVHGITLHGLQFTDDRSRPTAYFMEESGIGLLLRDHPMRGNGLHVGVLGLGVGTLAAYGEEGDRYRFYEINPAVIRLAEGQGGYFTYLSDSRANVSVIPGDARLSMERELAAGEPQGFDVLILDAFSSDSVPVHLVTREAFALYLQHLRPDGVIAANITNHHIDFQPLFWRLAQEYGLAIVRVERFSGLAEGEYGSHWVFLARDSALFDTPVFGPRAKDFDGYSTSVRLWTDDYSNLFQLLK
jgi:spermidine synthase